MAAAGIRSVLGLSLLASAACTSISVDARTFAGTRWRVVAINGYATPPAYPFYITFTKGHFTARMGCNMAQGAFRVEGERLVPGMAGSTEMACEADGQVAVPPMTFERWGFTVFGKPMRITWKSASRLTLNNSSGSIELQRQS